MSVEIRHRHRILEAIDQLRRRKARPDVNRICSFMFRRFSVSCGETKSDLQKLIDAEIVIKVDYKGNTSYRNAAKWAMLPNYKNKQELNSSNTSSILASAVAELIVLEPDYLDIGVPADELESHLLKKDCKRFTKKNLETVLKREIENGILVKLENGNYFLGEHSSKTKGVNQKNKKSPKAKKLKAVIKKEIIPHLNTPVVDSNFIVTPVSQSADCQIVENIPVSTSTASTSTEPIEPQINNQQHLLLLQKELQRQTQELLKKKMEENADLTTVSPAPPATTNGETIAVGRGRQKKELRDTQDLHKKMEEFPGFSVVNPPTTTNGETIGVSRVGGRQKRAKVMFDPSDNNLPKWKRKTTTTPANQPRPQVVIRQVANSRPTPNILRPSPPHTSTNSTTVSAVQTSPPTIKTTFHIPTNPPMNPGICSICHSYGLRIKGVPERLVSCSDCTHARAHPSCVESSKGACWKNKNGFFQCLQCKKCNVCNETGKSGVLVVCTSCGDGYHCHCHTPQLSLKLLDLDRWICFRCLVEMKDKKPALAMTSVEASTSTMADGSCMVKTPSTARDCTIQSTYIICTTASTRTTNSISTIITPIASANAAPLPKTATGNSSSSVSTGSSTAATATLVKPPIDEPKEETKAATQNFEAVLKKQYSIIAEPIPTIRPVDNQDLKYRLAFERALAPSTCLQDPFEGFPIDESIPDVSQWSTQEVFQYFVKYFDPDIVRVFKEQEIDGATLLMMKRSDVLTGLCLKLGPALKVYSHVKRLQIRRSNPKLLWS